MSKMEKTKTDTRKIRKIERQEGILQQWRDKEIKKERNESIEKDNDSGLSGGKEGESDYNSSHFFHPWPCVVILDFLSSQARPSRETPGKP